MKGVKYLPFIGLALLMQLRYVYAQDTTGLAARLKQHVYFLADDKLQGRLTGTRYEIKASEYIQKQFEGAGLKAAGENESWYQSFSFNTGYRYGKRNTLRLNGKKLELEKGFYPMVYSASGKLKAEVVDLGFGISDDTKGYDDYIGKTGLEGKIFLINLSLPDGNHPHSKYTDHKSWRSRLDMARAHKPAGIVFYNAEDSMTVKAYRKYNNLQQEDIPLLVVSQEVKDALLKAGAKPEIEIQLERDKVEGRNVCAFVDNGKPFTIVIGAHYDHLGHGEYGNSLHMGKPEIHNGADDNASGTAALIECGRLLKLAGSRKYNYLLLAFSGEELGLLGSNYFSKNSTIGIDKLDAMLNMDMVGRLDTNSRELGINGIGTSPKWDSLIKAVKQPNFDIKTTESGMGSSDHTSFYLQNVPAIHFFTGNHKDYHKPSDDADKINYTGMADVVTYLYRLTEIMDKEPKLVFERTAEKPDATPRFKVTLGIIPDYFFDGEGVRIDGISPGKTAEKAGLQAGDIVLKMGDHTVKDMQGYMEALSKFNKGEKTEVEIKREGKNLKKQIEF